MREKVQQRLKELRKQKGMTQEDVAKELNITRPAYTQIESGTSSLSIDYAAKVAAIFDVSVDHILGIEERRDLSVMEKMELPIYKGLKNVSDFDNENLIVGYRTFMGNIIDGNAEDYFYHTQDNSNLAHRGIFHEDNVLIKKTNDFNDFTEKAICLASYDDKEADLYEISINDDVVSLHNTVAHIPLKKYQLNLLGLAVKTERDLI